jgi:hypothetical protein
VFNDVQAKKKRCKRKKAKTTQIAATDSTTQVVRAPGVPNQREHDSLKTAKMKEKLQSSALVVSFISMSSGIDIKSAQELEAFKVILEKHLIASNTTYYINQHFYNKKELALSRLATDIFIHVHISDALSGSVLEMLYANTQVITGSWLNYKTFKNANLDYLELQTIDELIELFTNPVIAKSTASNVNKVKENFNNAAIIARWHQTFQEL